MNTDKSKINFSTNGGLRFSAIAADYHIYPCNPYLSVSDLDKTIVIMKGWTCNETANP